MSERTDTWKRAKELAKERVRQTLLTVSPIPGTDGGAVGLSPDGDVVLLPAPSVLPDVALGPPSTATSATATGLPTTSPPSPSSSPSATLTSTISDDPTVWMLSPLTFVENASNLSTVPLSSLPPSTRRTLLELAEGRGEPVEATLHDIALFFIESESEYCEGTMQDAVTFYVTNYVLPTGALR